MGLRPEQILETCIYVDDLARAEQFYHETLGLELISKDDNRHLFFRLGRSVFLVFKPDATMVPGKENAAPVHGARGSCHAAFAVRSREIDPWREKLCAKGVEIEKEINWPKGGRSLYFRDPAGNSIELATTAGWKITENVVFD